VRRRAFLFAPLLLGCRSKAPAPAPISSASAAPSSSSSSLLVYGETHPALGSLEGLPEPMRRAVTTKGFSPMPKAGPDDWLTSHPEKGQTYVQFIQSRPNIPGNPRASIVIAALKGGERPSIVSAELLRDYAAAFFATPAKVRVNGDDCAVLLVAIAPRSFNRAMLTDSGSVPDVWGDVAQWPIDRFGK
jgi:hypothetical protein